jgi:phytol kinase
MDQIQWARAASFVAIATSCWVLSGYLRIYRGVAVSYTRKINHAVVLILGALWFLSLPLDEARASYRFAGAVLFAFILFACRYHQGGICRLIFRGYAREKDAPRQAFHVWFSWLVSLLGILAVDQFSGNLNTLRLAVLLLGVGDSLGEPVGVKFGKHPYFVHSILTRENSIRTVEGTGAVLGGSFVTALFSLWLLGVSSNPMLLPFIALALAAVVAAVEAYTPHGLDNLTIPLVTAGAVQCFCSFGIMR